MCVLVFCVCIATNGETFDQRLFRKRKIYSLCFVWISLPFRFYNSSAAPTEWANSNGVPAIPFAHKKRKYKINFNLIIILRIGRMKLLFRPIQIMCDRRMHAQCEWHARALIERSDWTERKILVFEWNWMEPKIHMARSKCKEQIRWRQTETWPMVLVECVLYIDLLCGMSVRPDQIGALSGIWIFQSFWWENQARHLLSHTVTKTKSPLVSLPRSDKMIQTNMI